MEIEKRKVSDLIPNPINVRRHNQTQIQEFSKSIKKFGIIRPIVVDENNVILAGHGLLEALKSQGAEEADVIVMNGLSDKDKKKLLLADNKIFSLGFDDYGAIESILSELGKESDFDIPGYDFNTLEELYGVKSVEKEIGERENPIGEIPMEPKDGNKQNKDDLEEPAFDYSPVPSKAVEAARAEAENRKFVICPNCGERIWL